MIALLEQIESGVQQGKHMYKVTGVDVYGKRFKIETNSRMRAFGINLFNGSVWQLQKNNKWKLLHRVYNG